MTTETKQTTLSNLRPQSQDVASLPSVKVGLTDLQSFELGQRAAKLLASSTLVPKEYQGNIPNCMIALNMSARTGADALMIMQNLVIVHGRPTWSAQFMISTVNTCGRFTALRYEFFGEQGTDSWGCRAWSIEKSTGEKLVGTDVTIGLAKAEGWYGRNGSKWKTMPQQMLMYRAGSWWARAHAPELSMGLQTAEEAYDFVDAAKKEDGSFTVDLESLRPAPVESVTVENEAKTVEAVSESKPVEFDTFNISDYKITTQAGCREATRFLCAWLATLPESERAGAFVTNGGLDVIAEINKNGLGLLKNSFVKLGVKLPE